MISYRKNKSLKKVTIQALIPVVIVFGAILIIMFQSMFEARRLVYRYIKDTASLSVRQIKTDLEKINYEVITTLNRDRLAGTLPATLSPEDSRYYPVLNEIREQNRNLKVRYQETYSFYVYVEQADVLILNDGTYYSGSRKRELYGKLMEELRQRMEEPTSYSEWLFLNDGKNEWLFSRYARNGTVMGCVIRLEDLFRKLSVTNMGYEGIPFIELDDGTVLMSSAADQFDTAEIIQMHKNRKTGSPKMAVYTFPFIGIQGELHMLITPSGGILERIMGLQMVFVVLTVCTVIGCITGVFIYNQRILRPMRQFITGLKNMEEEQWIHENGGNNLLELEMASKEFKGLLRKIKSLKIAIYEEELARRKVELEYVQEQVKPHFYLNCLSLIHGMADAACKEDIVHITEMLSRFTREVMSDSFQKRTVKAELDFVDNYIGLQLLRYGEEAFCFEVIKEDGVEECLLPPLLIQTFVENSLSHAVSLDSRVEISLYAAIETYGGEETLYITVSDTGKGFRSEILEAIETDDPIVYQGRKHIGIQNSMKRLRMMYGERGKICLSNMEEGYGAVVEIRIPAERLVL